MRSVCFTKDVHVVHSTTVNAINITDWYNDRQPAVQLLQCYFLVFTLRKLIIYRLTFCWHAHQNEYNTTHVY